MGLLPGTEVEVVRAAPMRDPIELRLRGYRLSIRLAEASLVELARESVLSPVQGEPLLPTRPVELERVA